jgi:hypothetical protein
VATRRPRGVSTVPREHHKIAMTEEELRSFVASTQKLILATVDGDERPWADAVACRLIGDRIYFRVPVGSRSYANILGDSRVCCVVEYRPGGSYFGIKGALIHGNALERSMSVNAVQLDTAFRDLPDPVQADCGETVIFSVGLDDTASFAFAKIEYRYEDRTLLELAD